MIEYDIEQRSPEWHIWRSEGIGGSESAAILGLSKYKTPYKTWLLRTGQEMPDPINEDMQRGIDLEDGVVKSLCERFGEEFSPVCGAHEKQPIFRASFDAINADRTVFAEIKCPRTMKLHSAIMSYDIKRIKEEFPDYWIQVQHQYGIDDNLEQGFLVAHVEGQEDAIILIPRDSAFIEKKLRPGIEKFWKTNIVGRKAPELMDSDYEEKYDPEWERLAFEYKAVDQSIKKLLETKEKCRQKLIAMCKDHSCKGYGLKVTKIKERGRVNYGDIPELENIDLERYRKDDIIKWRIS